jgi:hypothetical protein
MAIKAPGWCHTAVPTTRGWVDPNTGELLKSGKFTQAQIDEWHGVPTKREVLIETMPEPIADEDEHEEEYEYYDLGSMTKSELVELAEEFELDTSGMVKSEIIEALEEVME